MAWYQKGAHLFVFYNFYFRTYGIICTQDRVLMFVYVVVQVKNYQWTDPKISLDIFDSKHGFDFIYVT